MFCYSVFVVFGNPSVVSACMAVSIFRYAGQGFSLLFYLSTFLFISLVEEVIVGVFLYMQFAHLLV